MRVLLLSKLTDAGPEQSFANIVRAMLPEIASRGHVSVTVPRDWDEEERAAIGMENVSVYPVGMPTSSSRRTSLMMTEDLHRLLGQTRTDLPYDVVLHSMQPIAPLLSLVLRNDYLTGRFDVTVPMVCWHLYTLTGRFKSESEKYGEADLIADGMSAYYGTNVWESHHVLDSYLETQNKWLQPSVVERIRDRSYVVPNGVPLLDDVFRKRTTDRKPRVLWGVSSLAWPKRQRQTFAVMNRLMGLVDAELWITVGNEAKREYWEERLPSMAKVLWNVSPKEYHDVIGQCDVFVCRSDYETYGVGWLEMLAGGMLGVYEDTWWARRTLPKWYPFIATNEAEMVVMAKALVDSWPDGALWETYVPSVREWIADEHDVTVSARRMAFVLSREYETAVDQDRVRLGGSGIADLAVEAAESLWVGEALPEYDVWQRMKEMSDSGREFGKRGDVMSRAYLRRVLECRGWVDLARSADVEFVRA